MTLARASFTSIVALLLAAGCGGGSANTTTGTGGAPTTSSTGGSTTTSTATSSDITTTTSSTSTSTGTGGAGPSKWPDTTATIAILADQLPNLSAPQQTFAATHFVGSQKLTLAQSMPLRAINPKFLVLHYHLAIWQSAPGVDFIVDGKSWGNDYSTVDTHESWFWHNPQNQRIASTADQKLLMNLADPGFAAYWQSSLEQQVQYGEYDGIFADSASPALLQAEVGGQDSRLAGTGARDSAIAEWGGKTYIQVWETWISQLNDALAQKGIPLIPNTSAFVTSWDNTDYSLTAGVFVEGFGSPLFSESDWKASTNQLLSLAAKGKIIILQNYLGSPDDDLTRIYYLANYLLVKGDKTYLDYFANGPLEWYPEWGIDLGAPTKTGATVDDLFQGGLYRRDFQKGVVLLNPSGSAVTVNLGTQMQHVVPSGGGAIDANGTEPGSVSLTPMTSIIVPPRSGEIFLL
jgi:hypothetical protein